MKTKYFFKIAAIFFIFLFYLSTPAHAYDKDCTECHDMELKKVDWSIEMKKYIGNAHTTFEITLPSKLKKRKPIKVDRDSEDYKRIMAELESLTEGIE